MARVEASMLLLMTVIIIDITLSIVSLNPRAFFEKSWSVRLDRVLRITVKAVFAVRKPRNGCVDFEIRL